jgi:PAS domain S-box-containing protein
MVPERLDTQKKPAESRTSSGLRPHAVSRFGAKDRQPPESAVRGDFSTQAASPQINALLAHQVLQTAPIVIYVYDLARESIVFQNRRFGELLGHLAPEHSGEWMAYVHPEDAQQFPAHRQGLKAIRPGEALAWEFRMRDVSGDWRWFLSRDALLSSGEDGKPLLIVGSASEITEQKRAEQHKELLADEMRHRARNLVSIVQAIARMSRPKNQPEANKYIDTFMGRLLTLLNTGGIVLSSTARTADLRAIIEATLAPFGSENILPRVSIDGPGVSLSEHTAGGLALAFHELATNAIKYGALRSEAGTISIRWTLTPIGDGELFAMEWKESGGPPVQPPGSEGFGALVIRQSVARERAGNIVLDYLPDGLSCRFEFKMISQV